MCTLVLIHNAVCVCERDVFPDENEMNAFEFVPIRADILCSRDHDSTKLNDLLSFLVVVAAISRSA